MLIGLGEPFMDPQIFERIEFCHRHSISTLLSTNGTFLDEETAARDARFAARADHAQLRRRQKGDLRVLPQGREVREGARQLRPLRAHESTSAGRRLQVVVQMVRMEGNAAEVDDFMRFWSAVPGVDQVRIKADETNLMRPDAGHAADEWKHPCHYLWRGPMYVKQNGDVYPCCQSYMLDGAPVGNIGGAAAGQHLEFGGDAAHAPAARHGAGRRNRHVLALLHHHSASGAGGRQPDSARPHRAPPAAAGRAADLSVEAARQAAAACARAPFAVS